MSAMETDFVEEDVVENPTLKAAYNLAPLHHNQPLKWDYEVHLIGEKIYDKVIHLCEICELPILVYGRMLPCKHIFCFGCARKCEKTCKRCGVRVQKVEKSALGTVYVCTHGAPKHSTKGCRRTYLSQRDLQSHILHRHWPKPSSESTKPAASSTASQPLVPQLPLTQQQAALQQAAQTSAQPISAPVPSLSVQPGLMPNMADLTMSQAALPGTMNQGLIPGLGELPTGSSTSSIGGQGSPALPLDFNPVSVGMNFNIHSQFSSDQAIYRPPDRTALPQHKQQHQQQSLHQQQQSMLPMGANHMPGGPPKAMPRFGESSQVPISSARMQSMNSQQRPGVGQTSPSMHDQMHQHRQQPQQHHLMQEQQQKFLREQHLMHEQQQQQQQRLNLQHHVSLSKMPSPMLSSSHQRPSNQANLDSFGSSPNSYENLQGGEGRTNVNLITVPIQDEVPYPPMSAMGQAHGNNLPFSSSHPIRSPQTFPQSEVSSAMNRPNFTPSQSHGGGLPSPQSMPPFSQSPTSNNVRMTNNAMMTNPQAGLNNIQASAALAMIQALARPKAGAGFMPIPPRPSNPGLLSPRFNQTNWSPGNPRPMQPRMPQNQQRLRGDGQFKHNNNNYFG